MPLNCVLNEPKWISLAGSMTKRHDDADASLMTRPLFAPHERSNQVGRARLAPNPARDCALISSRARLYKEICRLGPLIALEVGPISAVPRSSVAKLTSRRDTAAPCAGLIKHTQTHAGQPSVNSLNGNGGAQECGEFIHSIRAIQCNPTRLHAIRSAQASDLKIRRPIERPARQRIELLLQRAKPTPPRHSTAATPTRWPGRKRASRQADELENEVGQLTVCSIMRAPPNGIAPNESE